MSIFAFNLLLYSKMSQVGTVIVNRDRYRAILNEFLFTKIEEEDIGDRHTHSRSYTRCFSTCFLKIALSEAELMSFGDFGAKI